MSATPLANSFAGEAAAGGPLPLPERVHSEEELDLLLSQPSPAALTALEKLDSDLVILGVSGKMGPTLARMAVRALDELKLAPPRLRCGPLQSAPYPRAVGGVGRADARL